MYLNYVRYKYNKLKYFKLYDSSRVATYVLALNGLKIFSLCPPTVFT